MIDLGPATPAFRAEVAAFYAGFGNPTALRHTFHDAVLLVPLTPDHRITTSTYGGVDWICAFTDAEEYARWLAARDALTPEHPYPYQTLTGAHLTDFAATRRTPTGIAVDIQGTSPMAFPPTVRETDAREGGLPFGGDIRGVRGSRAGDAG
ncbi:SseB family protein [Nocardia otitidiscaviarum]|uniref:SseB family protein n=1 Tax=Nocardia otitidiscaviarum TaxID=1823 RepID=UPI0024563AF9|nr:SseB family protein [Nocardia otitidiscaviarum]